MTASIGGAGSGSLRSRLVSRACLVSGFAAWVLFAATAMANDSMVKSRHYEPSGISGRPTSEHMEEFQRRLQYELERDALSRKYGRKADMGVQYTNDDGSRVVITRSHGLVINRQMPSIPPPRPDAKTFLREFRKDSMHYYLYGH